MFSLASTPAFAGPERLRLAALPPTVRSTCFGHLTRANLDTLEGHLGGDDERARAAVIGAALLRRVVHHMLAKREAAGCGRGVVSFEAALSRHALPESLQLRIAQELDASKVGPPGTPPRPLLAVASPPSSFERKEEIDTWLSLLRRLEAQAGESRERLWSLVEAAPWLEYVPAQCAHCGIPVADDSVPNATDEEVGLSEVEPTEAERPFVRGGWYRGPRGPVVLQLRCRACGGVSRWFRSSAAEVILTPQRWGRLCGEQEDLRAYLADGLGVPLRAIVPLDWDHVWSEARLGAAAGWSPPRDAPARNFAGRLDEGIGAWTHVLAVGAEPEWCGCVTDAYLRVHDAAKDPAGRADAALGGAMARHRATVEAARADPTGQLCQARTLNGFVLERSGFSAAHITAVMRRAAQQYGAREWWVVDGEDVEAGGG